jgi:pimeloyl-ACP methyl ester carboxylesterase
MPQVQIGDINLAYDDSGSGSAVVLLHGYPFNRSLWAEQVDALKHDSRVITPDLRGFGETDASESSSMDQMADDVAKLMDALEIPSAIIGGLSMGGYVVLAFQKKYPERVKALVLADTRPQGDTDEAKKTRATQANQAKTQGMNGIADGMLPKLLTAETVSKRPELVKRVRDMMVKTKPVGAAAALIAMAGREDHTSRLSEITTPTLILVGTEDSITPVKDSQTMHDRISGSKLIVIPNAAHVSNLEQTARFNTELLEFVSSV